MDTFGLFRVVGFVVGIISLVRNHRGFTVLIRRVRRCPSCAHRGELCEVHNFELALIRHGMHETYDAWLASDDWAIPTGSDTD